MITWCELAANGLLILDAFHEPGCLGFFVRIPDDSGLHDGRQFLDQEFDGFPSQDATACSRQAYFDARLDPFRRDLDGGPLEDFLSPGIDGDDSALATAAAARETVALSFCWAGGARAGRGDVLDDPPYPSGQPVAKGPLSYEVRLQRFRMPGDLLRNTKSDPGWRSERVPLDVIDEEREGGKGVGASQIRVGLVAPSVESLQFPIKRVRFRQAGHSWILPDLRHGRHGMVRPQKIVRGTGV